MRFASITLAIAITLTACGSDGKSTGTGAATGDGTGAATGTSTGTGTGTGAATGTGTGTGSQMADTSIVGVATDAGDFTTLLAALEAAELTDTLSGPGPFTVFAPTDAAFANLPSGALDGLLDDIPALTDVLLYHTVSGELPASAVVNASLVTTLNGVDVKVTVGNEVMVNNAVVTVTDIEASNGVIHVIDAVLLPPPSIAGIAAGDANFSTLVTALSAADLVTTLDGPGPFTVFAPTNAAFDALPAGTVEALLDDIPALTDILLYHVASGKLSASDVLSGSSVTTLQGSEATVDASGPSIAGAGIIMTDIPARNGTIHVIDAVMIP